MMHQVPLLRLQGDQADQLAAQCATYRKYALQCIPPSPARNHTMRVVQTVEGRLFRLQAKRPGEIVLEVSDQERCALREMTTTLLHAYGGIPSSEERTRALGELAAMRVLLERLFRRIPAL